MDLVQTGKRLSLRYHQSGTFSFGHLQADALDEGLYSLGSALADVQIERPERIVKITTSRLE